jgi:hypothetical protein
MLCSIEMGRPVSLRSVSIIGAQLEQIQFANSVFIAAIVGAFTLVGVIVYQIRGSNGR